MFVVVDLIPRLLLRRAKETIQAAIPSRRSPEIPGAAVSCLYGRAGQGENAILRDKAVSIQHSPKLMKWPAASRFVTPSAHPFPIGSERVPAGRVRGRSAALPPKAVLS